MSELGLLPPYATHAGTPHASMAPRPTRTPSLGFGQLMGMAPYASQSLPASSLSSRHPYAAVKISGINRRGSSSASRKQNHPRHPRPPFPPCLAFFFTTLSTPCLLCLPASTRQSASFWEGAPRPQRAARRPMGRAPCCDRSKGLKKGPWTPEEDKLLVDYIQTNGHGSWRLLPKLAGQEISDQSKPNSQVPFLRSSPRLLLLPSSAAVQFARPVFLSSLWLNRCGKSCRLRWTNYLRPDIKRGPFSAEEQKSIVQLHAIVGNNPSPAPCVQSGSPTRFVTDDVTVEKSIAAFNDAASVHRVASKTDLLPVLLIGFFRCWFCYLRWSMIAAQLPGRTDNEIKNYWNTHLKKQLRRMGLDDPPPGPASGCPAARHMAQWETARLEAEARLSLAAASSSPTGTTTTSVSSSSAVAEKDPKAADIFLRLWSSDIGDSFRRRKATEAAPPPLLMPAAPVVKRKDVVVIKQEEAQALPSGPGGDDSSAASSNETEAMEEMEGYYDYQTFVDNFAGEELGLFHGRYGGFSLFPPIDVLAEASLDTAF
ncbi:hypothetical protein HU200_007368 [Digitaria exilis]|uniref:Uncharacterized protein n=1 Tax=Digitaria exilis TaxID=1010633 RepID=A0A835FPN1_9POAL|nr:hypothetical protein HU200_007368 [Digitaria exilis]